MNNRPFLIKLLLSLIVPVFFDVAYTYGIAGGHDVVTGAPTPHFGFAFWLLLIVCGLAELVLLRKIWAKE